MKNLRKGFTLLELMVVIAIIGILSSVAVVSFSSARGKARDAKRISSGKAVISAMTIYTDDNSALPTAGTPGDGVWDGKGKLVKGSTTYLSPGPGGTTATWALASSVGTWSETLENNTSNIEGCDSSKALKAIITLDANNFLKSAELKCG